MHVRIKFLIIYFISILSYGQNCNCITFPELKNIISCKPYLFDNGNLIKWNYNCSGSQLIFENNSGQKVLFELEAPLIELTGRLGYTYWREFGENFIITNKVASGSHPAEYILFDKNSGDKIIELGYEIDENDKFIFFLNYTDDDNLNVIVFEKNNSKVRYVDLPNKIIDESMKNSNQLFISYLFSIQNIDSMEPVLMIKNYTKRNENFEYIKVQLTSIQ